MSDFLQTMAASSQRRADRLQPALVRSAAAMQRPLMLGDDPFVVLAECKLRAPSSGVLAAPANPIAAARERAATYAKAGATAISVLTEPSRFDGDIDHVTAAAGCGTPILRKDFLVDPAQVWEARAAGASGVLLIATMLSDAVLVELLGEAADAELFVLVEGFDADDLRRIAAVSHGWRGKQRFLAGLNCRDLRSLQVDFDRFEALAPELPPGLTVLAESGIASVDDARRVKELGYGGVLVGSALMKAGDPGELIAGFKAL